MKIKSGHIVLSIYIVVSISLGIWNSVDVFHIIKKGKSRERIIDIEGKGQENINTNSDSIIESNDFNKHEKDKVHQDPLVNENSQDSNEEQNTANETQVGSKTPQEEVSKVPKDEKQKLEQKTEDENKDGVLAEAEGRSDIFESLYDEELGNKDVEQKEKNDKKGENESEGKEIKEIRSKIHPGKDNSYKVNKVQIIKKEPDVQTKSQVKDEKEVFIFLEIEKINKIELDPYEEERLRKKLEGGYKVDKSKIEQVLKTPKESSPQEHEDSSKADKKPVSEDEKDEPLIFVSLDKLNKLELDKYILDLNKNKQKIVEQPTTSAKGDSISPMPKDLKTSDKQNDESTKQLKEKEELKDYLNSEDKEVLVFLEVNKTEGNSVVKQTPEKKTTEDSSTETLPKKPQPSVKEEEEEKVFILLSLENIKIEKDDKMITKEQDKLNKEKEMKLKQKKKEELDNMDKEILVFLEIDKIGSGQKKIEEEEKNKKLQAKDKVQVQPVSPPIPPVPSGPLPLTPPPADSSPVVQDPDNFLPEDPSEITDPEEPSPTDLPESEEEDDQEESDIINQSTDEGMLGLGDDALSFFES